MDKDFSILTKFEGIVFNYLDVMKLFKTTRSDAYARIKRLMKVGLLIEESSFNPKSYRVKKVVDWGTKFSLQQPIRMQFRGFIELFKREKS